MVNTQGGLGGTSPRDVAGDFSLTRYWCAYAGCLEQHGAVTPVCKQPEPRGRCIAAGAAVRKLPTAESALGRIWPATQHPKQAAQLEHPGTTIWQPCHLSRQWCQLIAESALGRLHSQPPAERRQRWAVQPIVGRLLGGCRAACQSPDQSTQPMHV